MKLTFASTGESISATIISNYQNQGVILDASGSVWRGDQIDSNLFLYSPAGANSNDPIPPSTFESATSWCQGIAASLLPLQANLVSHANSLAAALDAIKPIVLKTIAKNKGLLDHLPADLLLAERVRLWDGTTLASHIPNSIAIWVFFCNSFVRPRIASQNMSHIKIN
jgi:hypothetical protein